MKPNVKELKQLPHPVLPLIWEIGIVHCQAPILVIDASTIWRTSFKGTKDNVNEFNQSSMTCRRSTGEDRDKCENSHPTSMSRTPYITRIVLCNIYLNVLPPLEACS